MKINSTELKESLQRDIDCAVLELAKKIVMQDSRRVNEKEWQEIYNLASIIANKEFAIAIIEDVEKAWDEDEEEEDEQ